MRVIAASVVFPILLVVLLLVLLLPETVVKWVSSVWGGAAGGVCAIAILCLGAVTSFLALSSPKVSSQDKRSTK